MKRLIAAAVAASFAHAALAADMSAYKSPLAAPAPVVANWTGLYLFGFGDYNANFTDVTVNSGLTQADIAAAPHGLGLGGGLGYNYQLGPNGLVFGLRGDIGYMNMSGSGAINTAALSVSNASNYGGGFDGLVGLPLTPDGKLLGYGGAGFAFMGAKPDLHFGTIQKAASDTSTGWRG